MQKVWEMEKALIKDVLQKFPDPKPAYNTVATILKILEKKGFVAHKTYANVLEFYPLVAKDEYAKVHLGNFIKNYKIL